MSRTTKIAMAKGSAWMLLFKLTDRSIGFVSILILARILVPHDFGLVAMAMVLYAMLELLGAFGTDAVLIQKQSATRSLYDTAWTVNIVITTFEALLLAALAAPAAAFYDEPRLSNIIYVLACGLFIGGLKNVGIVAFRKEMQFHKEYIFLVGRKLSGFLVTVPLAFLWRDYWALVAGMVTSKAAEVILSYTLHGFRPRFRISEWSEIYRFSKWLYINNFLFFLGQRAPEFLLGKLTGPQAVGLYNISYELGTLPNTSLVAPINRAVYPGYAKLTPNPDVLKQTFLQVLSTIALIALPAGFGLAITSDILVPLLLGEKWLDAVPIVSPLAAMGAFLALNTNSGSLFLALGKPNLVTFLAIFRLGLLLPLIGWAAWQHGPQGVAWAVLSVTLVMFPTNLWVTSSALGLSATAFFSVLARPFLGIIVMVLTILVTKPLFSVGSTSDSLLAIFAIFVLGAVAYTLTVFAAWAAAGRPEGLESTLIGEVRTRLRFFSPSQPNQPPRR